MFGAKPLVDYKIETPEMKQMKPNVELVTNKYGRGLGFTADEESVAPYAPRHKATYPVSFVKGETVTNKLPELIPKVSKVEPPSAGQSQSDAIRVGTKARTSQPISTHAQDRQLPAHSIPLLSNEKDKDSDKSDSDEEADDQQSEELVQGQSMN